MYSHVCMYVYLHLCSPQVLEMLDTLLKKPPVYATKNHAPTQRKRYVSILLALLQSKYTSRIKKFQQAQEVCAMPCLCCT
jgi:hypothetical protein